MFARNLVAVSALFSIAAAVPMQGHNGHKHPHAKRDIVWVTDTEVDIVTVPVLYTVWVDPEQPCSTPAQYTTSDASVAAASVPTTTSEAASSVYSAPVYSAPVYSAPVYSAPVYSAPSSSSGTSEYVAPASTYTAPLSTYEAPTTTSPYVAPTTSSTEAASTSSAAASAESSSSSSSSSSGSGLTYGMAKAGTSYTGDITYYTPGMGACGITSTDSDPIVAIAESMFDSYSAEAGGNPNNNPVCNKKISITGTDGSQYSATVVDRCTGCDESSIDLSPSLFSTVAPSGDGRVHNIKWCWD